MRFDRWGALGKILATIEVFRLEGVSMDGKRLERYVNVAFPRTFSCQRIPAPGEALPSPHELRDEYSTIFDLLRAEGVSPERAVILALDEIGERRCIDPIFLWNYMTRGPLGF